MFRSLPQAMLLSGLLILSGCRSTLTLDDIDEIEFRTQPYSAWYYEGTQNGNHHVRHESVDSEIADIFRIFPSHGRKYRMPESLVEFESPQRVYRRPEKWKRLTVAVREEFIRFGLPDQKPRIIPFESNLGRDWDDPRPTPFPELADRRDRNRQRVELWRGYVLYADQISDQRARGNVFVERTVLPEETEREGSFLTSPRHLYGEAAEYSAEDKRLTISGSPAAEWTRGVTVARDEEAILILNGETLISEGSFRYAYGNRRF